MFDIIPRHLFIDELIHGLVALPFALYMTKVRGYKSGLFVLIFTYLVDIDHLFDYFLYFGFGFSLHDFLGLEYFRESGQAFVFFHAWEWMMLLSIIVWRKGISSRWGIILAAYLPHLVYDAFGVKSFWFYSIIYRYLNNFTLP